MKRALSWLVWIVGVGLSVFAFAALGVREWPGQEASVKQWLEFVGFGSYAALMVAASLFALRRRRWAGVLLIATSLPVPALFLMSADSSLTVGQRLAPPAVIAATLCAPGAFWVVTGRRKWPALLSSGTSRGKAIALSAFSVTLFAVAVLCTVTLFVLNGPEPIGDCGRMSSLNVRQLRPKHCVFTARTIRVGGLESWSEGRGIWALTRVEENFWGAPRYAGGYVFVFGGLFGAGEEWLFDTYRYDGILSRYTPVLQLRRCARNGPVQMADTDLRVLRDHEPWSGVRIIGTTMTEKFSNVPGAKVVIHGPAGATETAADAQGIFDIKGLPPGSYTITAIHPAKREQYSENRRPRDLTEGEAWGRAVYVSE